MNMQMQQVPRFSIYKPGSEDKEQVDTLIHCFIIRRRLDSPEMNLPAYLTAEDGVVYQAIYEGKFPYDASGVDVIISFQKHTYGNFAVIRKEKRH